MSYYHGVMAAQRISARDPASYARGNSIGGEGGEGFSAASERDCIVCFADRHCDLASQTLPLAKQPMHAIELIVWTQEGVPSTNQIWQWKVCNVSIMHDL